MLETIGLFFVAGPVVIVITVAFWVLCAMVGYQQHKKD